MAAMTGNNELARSRRFIFIRSGLGIADKNIRKRK